MSLASYQLLHRASLRLDKGDRGDAIKPGGG